MPTVEELQQQLEALRKHHREVEQQEILAFEKVSKELADMQELTEALEKEEKELERHFSSGRRSDGQEVVCDLLPLVGNIVLGLVDADEAKCKRR